LRQHEQATQIFCELEAPLRFEPGMDVLQAFRCPYEMRDHADSLSITDTYRRVSGLAG